jgi:hypothetical protein
MTQSVLRIEDFLARLHKVTLYGLKADYNAFKLKQSRETINKLCKKEVDFLRRHVELKTLRRYRTDYRNAIKLYFQGKEMALTHKPKGEKESGHIALKYFILKRSEVASYGESEKARKEAYLCGNRVLIDRHDELIAIGTDLLGSTSFYEVAIGLLLLTGRRPVEILKTGSFEVISENKVRFFGQAKTRESEQARDGYEIYTLCNAQFVCNALTNLRNLKDFSNKTNRQTESSTSGRLGVTLRKHLMTDDFFFMSNDGTTNNLRSFKGIEVKALRDIWLNIAHLRFEPLSDIHNFATRMLGHVSGSTASNYMEFMIIPK